MTAPLRDITGKIWRTERRVLEERKTETKVVRRVKEIDELFGMLSCGHVFKWSKEHDTKTQEHCIKCQYPQYFDEDKPIFTAEQREAARKALQSPRLAEPV